MSFTWLCQIFLLLPLMAARGSPGTATPPAAPDAWQRTCESRYESITYCVEDGGNIHVVIVDLHDPNIRFEMVMAEDVTSVDTTRRERIEDMVNRPPYAGQSVIVAINADYFGRYHGPEGLSVKNGRRLDGGGFGGENPHALWRSSLAISRLNHVSLGRKTPDELLAPRVFRERFYNAIGGGPLILNYGVVIPNSVACILERFPLGACRRTIQTAAGLSEDGRWLYLAVGEGRDIEGFARLLRDYGAFTAIKLDGGGSSQLWYDGLMRYDTDRAVGNALFLFYSPVPRHDAYFEGPSDFLVVEAGERVTVPFRIHNSGFLDWEPDLGYRFRNVRGWPLLGPAFQRLPVPVPAGGALDHAFTLVAPYRPGVYTAEWQLGRRTESIGATLWFGLVVVPPGHDPAEIVRQVARWGTRPDVGPGWPALRRALEAQLLHAAEAAIRRLAYDANGDIVLPVEPTLPAWWWSLNRHMAW